MARPDDTIRPAPTLRSALALALVPVVGLLPPAPVGGSQTFSGELAYTADAVHVARGGLRSGTAWLGNLDAVLRLEGLGSGETSMFLHVLGNHGDALSRWIGDVQVTSNIEAPHAVRVFEAWIERDLRSRGLSFLLGLYDLNSEFDVIEAAGLFTNSSFGIGPDYSQSGVTGPSIFPVSSLSARVVWRPRPDWSVKGAVLDGVPGDPDDETATTIDLSSRDGALVAVEVGWRPGERAPSSGGVGRSFAPDGTTKVAVGLWYYTRDFRPLLATDGGEGSSVGRSPHPGVYALAERRLWSEADRAQGLSLFARAGSSDPAIHQLGSYTGAGAVYTGLLPGRPGDRLGLAVAAAHNGSDYRTLIETTKAPVASHEVVVELTYRIAGAGWALQPDLQWVRHPGTDPTVDDALALGIRGEVSVTF